MHLSTFLAELSKVFNDHPSLNVMTFVPIDKDLDVVPDSSAEKVASVKVEFTRARAGLEAVLD